MAWTSLSFSFGSLLTSAKMTQLYDNITALANGDSGAPLIQEAAMDTASVNQAALKTTTGTASLGTVYSGQGVDITIPGGLYYLGLEANLSSDGSPTWGISWGEPTYGSYGALPLYVQKSAGSGGYGGNIRSTYVQASPPYDLGDGLIHDFIFFLMNPDGTVDRGFIAPDAPWHYSGPTDIRPDRKNSDGRCYKKVPVALAEELEGKRSAILLPERQKAQDFNIEAILQEQFVEIEIDQKYKNRDMDLLPHPFIKPKQDQTIIMIDPVSDVAYQLQKLREQGGNPLELFEEERFLIGNKPLDRKGPMGVQIVEARWKNFRGDRT